MKTKRILRYISLAMLCVAVIFVYCALAAPTLGRTIYIGSYKFGAEQWRICYAVYAAVMLLLFVASFLVKNERKNNN